ncbi:MAG: histidinol-phosphate aminotransferase [Flavobacteriaceae bacterium]|jgi:histidinol-phosphate aminotransferase
MFDLNKITRANIRRLKPYSSARDEFSGADGIFLDANENPYGEFNRYPDPYQRELKQAISDLRDLDVKNIFVGNGSDEIIDLLFRIFCNPSTDKALTFSPTYGMYDVTAEINDIALIKVELNAAFDVDFQSVEAFISDPTLKLMLICSPNNPTGNCLDLSTIKRILKAFDGIVLIDEAYIDFGDTKSFIDLIDEYPNLIVSQTMSKAWGLAAARVGFAFANSDIIDLLNKVKPPYNVSGLNQSAAINALKKTDAFLQNKNRILREKNRLYSSMNKLEIIKKIYPSQANFFLVETQNADQVYKALVKQKIVVRNRNNVVRNCLRITVGTTSENKRLIQALKSI